MGLLLLIILALIASAILHEWDRTDERPCVRQEPCCGCGADVAQDWLICPRCRTLLRNSCQHCRQLIPARSHFCPHCGALRKAQA